MNKIKILNLYIDNFSMAEFLSHLKSGVVFTPNVDHLVRLQTDREFIETYKKADYRVCDSQLIMLISRLLGTPLKEKISGSDLFPAFYDYHKNNEEIKIFLLGAMPGVAQKAQEKINNKVGRKIVVDVLSPSYGFEKNEAECLEIIEKVNASDATVLAVGLGAPKQENFIVKYKDKFTKIKIFMGIGATIDFEAGNVMRSPKWVSQLGLEWLFRLFQQPKRLWKRYLWYDLRFFWFILKQKLNIYAEPFQDV